VDLGQRGTWPLGACENRPKSPGEKSYVDAIIDQASTYAREHDLPFTDNLSKLRSDLLSHGNGKGNHPTISFIDKDTRDTINAWATSPDGRKWIHENIDYPQVRDATAKGASLLENYGSHISADRRFETVSILAKTANQMPSALDGFKAVMEKGGGYRDVLDHAQGIRRRHSYYDGPKAAAAAERYEDFYGKPDQKVVLDRAHAKVSSSAYDPSKEGDDPDIQRALEAIGSDRTHAQAIGSLRPGSRGRPVESLQSQLGELGYLHGVPDGKFGPATRAAVEAFQRDHGVAAVGAVGPATQRALRRDVHSLEQHSSALFPEDQHTPRPGPGLDDPRNFLNPNHSLFATLERRLPDASEDRLLQFTGACRSSGITAENLGKVHLDERTMTLTFAASWPPGAVAQADLTQPPPAPQQSIQHIQALDQLDLQAKHQAVLAAQPSASLLAGGGGPSGK